MERDAGYRHRSSKGLPLMITMITICRFTAIYKYTVIRDKTRPMSGKYPYISVNIPLNTVNVSYSNNVPSLYALPLSRPPEPFRLGLPAQNFRGQIYELPPTPLFPSPTPQPPIHNISTSTLTSAPLLSAPLVEPRFFIPSISPLPTPPPLDTMASAAAEMVNKTPEKLSGVQLYSRFALAGAVCCSVTHGGLTPVDV